ELLDEDVALTGVGFGSAFGMEPLSAEQVAESTLQTLTSEFAYVRVDQDADWSEVTCEDGQGFSRFETVDCAATTADGTSWDLVVAPGIYADNDQGLLVGIDRTSAGRDHPRTVGSATRGGRTAPGTAIVDGASADARRRRGRDDPDDGTT